VMLLEELEECLINHSRVRSMFTLFFAEIERQWTSRFLIAFSSLWFPTKR
jgi:hypothetical protein